MGGESPDTFPQRKRGESGKRGRVVVGRRPYSPKRWRDGEPRKECILGFGSRDWTVSSDNMTITSLTERECSFHCYFILKLPLFLNSFKFI